MGGPAGAVFVTGATSGIGAACARRFGRDGCPLILLGRRSDRLHDLARELDVAVHVLPLDIRDRCAVEAAVRSLPDAFARIEVLVNNAGLSVGFGPAQHADWDAWEQVVDTNVKGVLACTCAVLPGMIRRGRGHIVNIGSLAARHAFPGANVYGATKAFVRQFSTNLRSDLLGHNIRVTLVNPGLTRTELFGVRFGGDQRRAAAMFAGTEPLEPEDVAEAVRWVTTLPPRVNVDAIEMMPVMQAFASPIVVRAGRGKSGAKKPFGERAD